MSISNALSVNNQRGFAPIILVIVLVIAIAGVAVVKKDLFIKSNGSAEVADSKTPDQSPGSKADIAADEKGGLADKPFEEKNSSGPKFSIIPPAGWTIKPASGDNRATFEAPDPDESEEGLAYFNLYPNINVYIAGATVGQTSLEDILPSVTNNFKASGKEDITTQKLKFAGEDAYYFESMLRVGKLGAKEYEAQLRSEIAKSNKKVPEADIQKGVKFISDNFNLKLFGYIFYKDDFIVVITGKSLTSFWDKRYPQLKASIDTFKFLPKITK